MITRKTLFNLLHSSKENFYMIKSLFNISDTNCAPPQDLKIMTAIIVALPRSHCDSKKQRKSYRYCILKQKRTETIAIFGRRITDTKNKTKKIETGNFTRSNRKQGQKLSIRT